MDKINNETSYASIITTILLFIYVLSPSIFEKYHFHYMHESGMCMVISCIISILDYKLRPEKDIAKEIRFDEEIFFSLILPPIIFSAGYNLKRKGFYKYFLYILSFGLIGTIVNFILVAPITYFFNKFEMFYVSSVGREFAHLADTDIFDKPINFKIKEILMFAAVITATDTVAALTFVSEKDDPKLQSILFGEGVVNDGVCIVLYKVVYKILSSNDEGKQI